MWRHAMGLLWGRGLRKEEAEIRRCGRTEEGSIADGSLWLCTGELIGEAHTGLGLEAHGSQEGEGASARLLPAAVTKEGGRGVLIG